MTAAFLFWIGIALFESALSGGVALLDKRLLSCLDPMAANMLVRAVSVGTILIVTAPLTLLHLWSLTYAMTWEAAAYVTVLAVVGWLIAQNLYYFALRSGRVSVVIPVVSTDLLFTALFATLFVAGVIGPLTLAGLVVAVVGVSFIARAERLDAAPARGATDVVVADGMSIEPILPAEAAATATAGLAMEAAAAQPEAAPSATAPAAPAPAEPSRLRRGLRTSAFAAVLLALGSAAGWGLAPVLIQLAQESVGGTSVTMILQAQGLGLLMIFIVSKVRGIPLTTRRLTPPERRRALRFVLITGAIEGACAIMFYLVIENLGSVQAAVIAATSPIFAILWSGLFLRERLSRRLAVGVAVTLLGVFLATADGLG